MLRLCVGLGCRLLLVRWWWGRVRSRLESRLSQNALSLSAKSDDKAPLPNKPTPPPPHTIQSYTSKAFVEATHWQSEPFKAFMATMDAGATWLTKSITTYVEADAGF